MGRLLDKALSYKSLIRVGLNKHKEAKEECIGTQRETSEISERRYTPTFDGNRLIFAEAPSLDEQLGGFHADDYMVIPWPIDIDPLYRGIDGLTGRVPPGWSKSGWVCSLRDRITRTHIQPGRRRLQTELGAIEAAVKPSPQGDKRAPLRRARWAGAGTPSEGGDRGV